MNPFSATLRRIRTTPPRSWCSMAAALLLGSAVNLLPDLPVSPAVVVTESVPRGLYLIHREPAHLERGTMASFIYQAPAWAADRRYSNNPQFTKYVLGVPRDVVSLINNRIQICSPQAVCIDGGAILAVDSAARPMQAFPYGAGYTLSIGEYYFGSTHNPKSYDARYFGPVPIARVLGAITPLVTG